MRSADQERAIGGDRGQRGLDEMVAGAPGEQDRDSRDDEADGDPAAADQQRLAENAERRRRARRLAERGDDQREQQRRDAVVDQALALDDQPQAAFDAGLAQQRDDGDRVGGGDERAEGERRPGGPAEQRRQSRRDHGGAKRDAERGEREDGGEIAPEFAPGNADRGLEQQRRQDHVENDVVRQRHADVDARQRQAEAGQDQPDGVGQAQPARQDRHHHGDAEQLDRRSEHEVHAPI